MGAPTVSDLIHPEIASLLIDVPFGPINAGNLAATRERQFPRTTESTGAVVATDHRIEAPGDDDVVVRVYRPADANSAKPLPCVYAIHGGGYIIGTYEMEDDRFELWCQRFNCVGVSVEYRLAPEHPYPTPLEDCYRGLLWTYQHAAELGVDPNHIGIAGVSAGGGLTAALALLARDRGEIPVRFQLLDCPMLDDRQHTSSSQLDGLPIWGRDSNEFGWRSYLGDRYGTSDIPYHAAPARATDLSGLPPALVCVGAMDGFRDEDIDYALRLNQAGVPAELHVYPGAPHGVMMFASTSVARQYQRDIDEWIGRQLAP
jgi:acetyl esterase/lipase